MNKKWYGISKIVFSWPNEKRLGKYEFCDFFVFKNQKYEKFNQNLIFPQVKHSKCASVKGERANRWYKRIQGIYKKIKKG